MADLLYTARTQFPQAKVFLNSILIRRDLNYKALFNFNSHLELMCFNFNVQFVEINCSLGRRDLARDGRHLNRRGVSRLESLFLEVIMSVRSTELIPVYSPMNQDDVSVASNFSLVLESDGVVDSSHAPHVSLDGSHISGN